MPIDAEPRPPFSTQSRLLGAIALAILTGSPAVAQFTPRFEARPSLNVQIGAEAGKNAFVVADVNNDQLPDIMTIEPGPDRVDVYLNRGDGMYELGPTPGTAGVTPRSLAVADVGSRFDSADAGKPDGKPDIVVAGDGGEIVVLFGRNDGEFDEPSEDDILDVGFEGLGVAIGDFDEQDGPDIALMEGGEVLILCNSGSGGFGEDECASIEIKDDPRKIVSADFNADGDVDLAVVDGEEQTLQVILGNGNATFEAVQEVGVQGEASDDGDASEDMTVARVDGDNIDDILVINSSVGLGDQFGAVVLGTSGRFRLAGTFTQDFGATAITAADFDAASDQATDAMVGFNGNTSNGSSGIRVSIGSGNGEFAMSPFQPSGMTGVGSTKVIATADVGGDTLPDVLVLNNEGNTIRVFVNKSNEPTPTPGTPTPDDNTPTFTPTGPPVDTSTVTATPTPVPTETPTPIPTANFGRCDAEVGGTNLTAIAAGDLDGDAQPDLAASDAGAGAVRIIFSGAAVGEVKACARAMSSMGIASTSVSLGGRTPGPIAIGDFDRDGVNEIAVGAGDRVLFLDRGDGTTFAVTGEVSVGGTVRALTASYPNQANAPESRALLDLNGDMRGDLIIANGSTTLTIVYGAAGALPGQTVTQATSCGATALDAGDFNGDGRIDIAVGCGSRATWLQQQAGTGGTPTFQPKNDFASGAPIVGVAAGYLDNNGNADLLLTRGGASPGGESYLFSNGTFVLAEKGRFSAGATPIAGALGSFNPLRRRFDAVIGSQMNSELQFSYTDTNGGFPGPVVIPFDVHPSPNALVVVDFDNDSHQDVALANSDGTVTILVSSEPPPTPTPTVTPTATDTLTPTITQTPSLTPTPTSSPNGTATASPTRTGTPGPSPTPTATRGGIVLGSCAVTDGGGASPLQVALIALLLAGARIVTARRTRVTRTPHGR